MPSCIGDVPQVHPGLRAIAQKNPAPIVQIGMPLQPVYAVQRIGIHQKQVYLDPLAFSVERQDTGVIRQYQAVPVSRGEGAQML